MTYDDANEATRKEIKISRALAVAIHFAFLLLLMFGISWQKRHSEPAAVVELWNSLSPPKEEVPAPQPQPKPVLKLEPKFEPPPAPRPEVKPPPKPEAKPAPKPEVKPTPKPDIALKEKLEKERKLKELQAKKEDEAKKQKAHELEAKKKEDEKKKLEKEKAAQEAEAKRLAQEKQAIADQLAKQQAAAQRSLNEKYIGLIQNHVKRQIIEPPNLQGNPQVEFDVVLIPGGEVLTVKLRRSSGVPAYDAAVERAILKSSPLPLPPDPALFQQFRDLHLKIRPKE